MALAVDDWRLETLDAHGTVSFRPGAGHGMPLSGPVAVRLQGEQLHFSSDALRLRDAGLELDGRLGFPGDLAMRYVLRLPLREGARPLLADLGARMPQLALGGALRVEGTLEGKLPSWTSSAQLSSEGLSVEGLAASARGTLAVTASGDPGLAFALQLRADPPGGTAAGALAVASVGTAEAPGPMPAELALAGRASRHGWLIDRASASLGGGSVEATGSWSPTGKALEGRVEARGVEIRRLPWRPAALAELAATLDVDAALSGPLAALSGKLRLSARGVTLAGAALPELVLDAAADGRELTLEAQSGGAAFLTGRMPMADPWSLHAELDLARLPLSEALRSRRRLAEMGVALALSGRATLDVPLRSPADARYQARVESLDLRLARDWHAGRFTIGGDREAVRVEGVELHAGESRLTAAGTLGLAAPSPSPLSVRGELALEEFAALLPGSELRGQASLELAIGGLAAEPELGGRVRIKDGGGRAGALRVAELEIDASLDDGLARLTTARARLAGGTLTARGALPLGARASGRQELAWELSGADLGSLVPGGGSESPLSVPLDVEGWLAFPGSSLASLEAGGRVARLALVTSEERLELEAPVDFRVERGGLSHAPLRLNGARGNLEVKASVADAGNQARLALQGRTDLAILNPFLGGAASLGGALEVDAAVERGPQGWGASGWASVSDARFASRTPAMVVTGLSGTLRMRGPRLELEQWSGSVGDGRLEAGGSFGLAPAGLDADLVLRARDVPLEYPEGLRSRSSGELRLLGKEGGFRVEGDVVVRGAVYQRQTHRASQSLERLGAELGALKAEGSFLERLSLGVRVRLADGLRVSSDQANLVVDGALAVGGDLLTPELAGSLALREGGTLRVARALLRIRSGRVELAGYPARAPELDVQGATQVTGVRIDVGLSGPLDDFRMSLSSPNRTDLGQGDLATLILTGRTASAAASEGGTIVAEEVAAALGEALDRKLGGAVFIDVSRDESLIVEDTDPAQRFNIGIPLSRRLYVIYSRALDGNSLRWIVDVRPGGEFRLRFIANDDGSEAVEVSHRFGLNLWSRGLRPPPPREARPRIAGLVIEGAAGDEAELRRRLELKPGDAYDYFRGEDAARRAQDWLRARGYAAATVVVAERPADPGRLDVVARVERGPRYAIEWRGDDPGGALRERARSGWDAPLPLPETAARLARELQALLRAQGFYQARVSAEAADQAETARVVFEVRRGPRGRGVDVCFAGNGALSAATLAAELPARDSAAFFALLEPDGHGRLAETLRLPYAREGFLDARAGAPQVVVDAGSDRVVVTIPIEEGERARVVSLELPDEARAPSNGPAPRLQLRAGEPFRMSRYLEDRARLTSWYRDRGYPEARVAGVLQPGEHGVVVRFAVDPGPRPRVGEVRLARAGRTRMSVVDDALTLGPGDLLRPRELDESRARLSETRVFRSVELRQEPADAGEVRDIVVDLVERSDLDMEYSVRYTTGGTAEVGGSPSESQAGLQLGAALEATNPFGRAHRYRVNTLFGAERRLFGARLEAATFFGRRLQTQVFLFDDEDRRDDIPGLAKHVTGSTFQQTRRWRSGLDGRRWHDRLRLLWGYTFKHIEYTDLDSGAALAGDRAGPFISLVGDSRDSITDPRKGLFWSLGSELALRALGADVTYLKLYGQLFAYLPLGKHVTWAQGLRLGVVPGDDPLLLLESRFRAGGASSVRGFAESALGPATPEGADLGGQAMAVFNQELRFPIWKRLHGGLFYDAGNVFALARRLDLGQLRHSAGAGLRLMLPFGPIRLDWAQVLDPEEGEQRPRFVFSIGHAF
jgi:outer membrane protein insertion porin family